MLHRVLCCVLLCSIGGASVFATERIIGGEEVSDINDFRFQVALRCLGVHSCGGVIISRQFVLTSADCVRGCRLADLTVHSDSKYLNRAAVAHEALASHYHPLFTTKTRDYDIGLVRVFDRDLFNEFAPIIMSEIDLPGGWPVTTLGWGLTAEGDEPHAAILQKVDLTVIPRDDCYNLYNGKPGINITLNMMCTSTDSGNGTCAGDFGGPLIDSTSGTNRLVAIAIESGAFCGRSDYPSVFIKLQGDIRQWIKSIALV